ncbi:integrase arm-type DNA-binding domain-containing protein [Guyparkeria hydrothermalis]|uniref:tyrosine-type recombinase/integrase n=1 Tax=Guyparkeria hydrothermalis TaxID=923 RepID=UPI0020224B47|nr:integrase arm-type DNA-binding domain-containing protein [Guyparkeria hydrothermalis]MCL7751061.1 integrase arm-type DNA-binding domain-containing protein [Guyparkeria hydrothermalis]
MGAINKLTVAQVRNAKFSGKVKKLHDGGGLFLRVRSSGSDWVFRFSFHSKTGEISLGKFPLVSLRDARQRRDDARKLLSDGVDPRDHRREQQRLARQKQSSQSTLRCVGEGWLAAQNYAASYGSKVQGRLELHIYPRLGDRPIGEITPPELLDVLRVIETAGTSETARRARQHVSSIYRYAIASGLVMHDPAAHLSAAMAAKKKPKHHPAITDPQRLGQLLRAIEGFPGQKQVRAALQLAPMLMVRPGELRGAEWSEVDLETATWTIPAEKMKMREDHIVPLPRQAEAILRSLLVITGHRQHVFPGVRSPTRPISNNTLNAALRSLGFGGDEVVMHGFRATARTLLDEVLGERPDLIEHQLAHSVRDANGRAYNRTRHLSERRNMMQRWADYLESLRSPEEH